MSHVSRTHASSFSGKWKPDGITPRTVWATLSSLMLCPTIAGLALKRERHSRSLITTSRTFAWIGPVSGNPAPSRGRTPSTAKMLLLVSIARTRSGSWPSPVSVSVGRHHAAASVNTCVSAR